MTLFLAVYERSSLYLVPMQCNIPPHHIMSYTIVLFKIQYAYLSVFMC
jgi:hypothetical protein